MDELTGREVLEFLRGGLPSQKFIAVRMAAEACDDVAMAAGLIC